MSSSSSSSLSTLRHSVGDKPIVRFILANAKVICPSRMTKDSVGYDIHYFGSNITLPARGSIVLTTGVKVSFSSSRYYFRIAGRSGLAFRVNIIPHNGIIDPDYKGEIKVKLFNLSDEDYEIVSDERVAQLMLEKLPKHQVECVVESTDSTIEYFFQQSTEEEEKDSSSSPTKRIRCGGFGSTGR